MSQSVLIRVRKPIPGYHQGQEVAVQTDSNGTPLDLQWRRRFRDSKTDGCLEIVTPTPKAPRRPARREEPSE